MKVFIFLVIALTACHAPARVSNIRDESNGVQPIEYEVYSYLLRAYRNNPRVRVSDSTIDARAPRVADALRVLFCRKTPNSEYCDNRVFADFETKNKSTSVLDSRFFRDMKLKSVRDLPVIEPTCDEPTIVTFSRVGVNPERTLALVRMSYRKGKGPDLSCGFSEDDIMLIRREGKTWKEVGALTGIS